MTDWQPIETAPFSVPVLVWDGQVTVGRQAKYPDGKCIWWVHDTYGFCEDGQIYKPTHWCPLPEGPKS